MIINSNYQQLIYNEWDNYFGSLISLHSEKKTKKKQLLYLYYKRKKVIKEESARRK